MSINLDIAALATASKACAEAADVLADQAERARAAATRASGVWSGASHDAFDSYMSTTVSPSAYAAASKAQELSSTMDKARQKAAELRGRSEGFSSILQGVGEPGCDTSAESGLLYSDDATFDPIDADIANAEGALADAQRAFWDAESTLCNLRTCSVRLEGEAVSSNIAAITSRLSAFRSSFSAYRSGMAELEAICAGAQGASLNIRDTSLIYSNGVVHDPAALNWWLSQPDHLLTLEEREFVAGLKAQGLRAVEIDADSLKLIEDGVFSTVEGPGNNDDLVESLLSAAGYTVGMHEAAFDLAEIITKLVDSEAAVWIKGIGKSLGPIGLGLSGVSASFESPKYYESHAELPEDRRISNQAAEWDLQFAISYFSVLPPVEDFLIGRIYSADEKTGLSAADHFYDWRYEVFGQYGW